MEIETPWEQSVGQESENDIYQRSVVVHRQLRGKISLVSKVPVETKDDLSLAYTPGVARPCELIAEDPALARELTIKRNTIGIVSDGSAVLGLGNIGPLGAIPVMEGKALLMKEFANIDAFPICLDTQDSQEIIETVRRIAPVFGGINLEDISAPRCFVIEQALQISEFRCFMTTSMGRRLCCWQHCSTEPRLPGASLNRCVLLSTERVLQERRSQNCCGALAMSPMSACRWLM